jgi:hypothetical protein
MVRERKGHLNVRLMRPGNLPASGVPLVLLDTAGQTVQSLPTLPNGQRLLKDVLEGEYYLAWTDASAGAGVSEALTVRPGKTTDFEHVLEKGGLVEVSCPEVQCGNEPVWRLALYSADGLELAPFLTTASPVQRFSREGLLVLGRLTPGKYELRLGFSGTERGKAFSVDDSPQQVFLPPGGGRDDVASAGLVAAQGGRSRSLGW